MILIIIIAFGFYRLANNKNQNKFLWPALAVGAYYLLQIIMGMFLALFIPDVLSDLLMVYVISIISGGIGVLIVYFLLQKVAANAAVNKDENSDLIDDNF